MALMWEAYADEPAARRAAAGVHAAGVPERDILVMSGSCPHDVRGEPVGEFAGTIAPDDPVGSFGDRRHPRSAGAGSFAGDPDARRQGSFADVERDTIVVHDGASPHVRVGGRRAVCAALRHVTASPEVEDRILRMLDAGRTVVLVELPDGAPGDVRAGLDEAAA